MNTYSLQDFFVHRILGYVQLFFIHNLRHYLEECTVNQTARVWKEWHSFEKKMFGLVGMPKRLNYIDFSWSIVFSPNNASGIKTIFQLHGIYLPTYQKESALLQ